GDVVRPGREAQGVRRPRREGEGTDAALTGGDSEAGRAPVPSVRETAMDPAFDAHLHLFSRTYYESLAAKAPGTESVSEKLAKLERGAGIRVPGPDLPEHVMRWLEEFDRHGVERAVVFSSSPEEATAVEQASLLANGRFVPAALIDPTSSNAATRAKELLAKGFRAVL